MFGYRFPTLYVIMFMYLLSKNFCTNNSKSCNPKNHKTVIKTQQIPTKNSIKLSVPPLAILIKSWPMSRLND